MVAKKRKHPRIAVKWRQRHPVQMHPALSEAAEAEYYAYEEGVGVYAEFWKNMGYYLEKGVDFPPYTGASLDPKRPNNRAPGWNGVFTFTFYWKENATPEVKAEFARNLAQAYGARLEESPSFEPSEVCVRLNGKKVKALTRMLNRQYERGYLVWKEL
jgi:hypothetical protein